MAAQSYKEFIAALSKAGAFGDKPSYTSGPDILEAPDMNLGATIELPPANTQGVVQLPQPKRLLALNGAGSKGQTVTITMGQSISDAFANSQFVTWGPVTGIVEFGSGSAFSAIEFDIPDGTQTPITPLFSSNNAFALTDETAMKKLRPFASRLQNYATLTVPASSVRVYARNDATYPFMALSSFPVTTVQAFIYDSSGSGSAVNYGRAVPTVQAFVTAGEVFGSQAQSRLRKTTCLIGSIHPSATQYWNPSYSVTMSIPQFAKRVWFPRYPINTSFHAVVQGFQSSSYREFYVGIDEVGPFELFPYESMIQLENNTSSLTQVQFCNAVFDLVV